MRFALRFLFVGLLAIPVLAQTSARPAITGVAFMRLYTTAPAAAQKFYGPTLGFQRMEDNGLWVYPVNKLQWLEVIPSPPPTPDSMMAGIAFMTSDAAALEHYLNAHGVATVQPMHNGQFGVHDPEGNLILFVQHDDPSGIPHRVLEAPVSPDATSRRIIHVGFIVESRDKENTFYRDLLGFRPYWHGTMHPGRTDFVSLQVPDGTDWIEYMLHNQKPAANLHDSGMLDHFSLGVAHMDSVLADLQRNGCEGKMCTAIQAGVDGKVQLNVFDPDQTRVEFMEFTPAMKPCCSPFTGPHPGPEETQ